MCGIAGIFAYRDNAPPVDGEELLRIREAMVKRGPDGAGLWVSDDGRIGLAHRRLTIIDLTDVGAQPMATADGRLRITFNGEIYNYRALRKREDPRDRPAWLQALEEQKSRTRAIGGSLLVTGGHTSRVD